MNKAERQMKNNCITSGILDNERGATAIMVSIVMVLLLMFTALAVDVGHLYGVRNELNNAADAGALAGAHLLVGSDGTLHVDEAVAEAGRVTQLHKSGTDTVTDYLVETGHWSFATRTFTANPATEQTDWQERSFAELDADPDFINAVRVEARRPEAPSFFAGIMGYENFSVSNEGVAWLGFAGTLYPGELDMPIAVCEDAITDGDSYTCNVGRMLNSGGNPVTGETAMWTNFTQDPCTTASSADMQDLTDQCSGNNETEVVFGKGIGTQNGVQDNILDNVTDCWLAGADSDGDTIPDTLWPLVLPVVQCGVDNTCSPLVGAVQVNVVWIVYKNDPQMNDVPTRMEDWQCSATGTYEERFACWKSFVDHFDLENFSGPPVTDEDYQDMYQKKNIFFLPDCTAHEPRGNSGGQNFGIFAEIPKLVK